MLTKLLKAGLGLLPDFGLPLAIAAALGFATFGGVQTIRLSHAQAAVALERQARADDRAKAEAAARIASENYRAEEQRRAAARQKEIDDAQALAAQLDADRAAALSAGDRLRRALAAERASSCPAAGNPAPAPAGSPAPAPRDLSALVQRRLDEAQDRIAGFADQAAAAGQTCERIHDSLTAR